MTGVILFSRFESRISKLESRIHNPSRMLVAVLYSSFELLVLCGSFLIRDWTVLILADKLSE